MNPQTQAEAKRILCVMDDLLDDLAIIAQLPPYLSAMPAADMQHLLDAFQDEDGGQEVQQQLTEHYDFERRLESASADMSQEDFDDLHFSTRSVVETMRFAGYPGKYRPVNPPSQTVLNFRKMMEIARELLLGRLSSTVEEDVVKIAVLNDTVSREKNASDDVQHLTREHAQEKESRRVEVERRDATIRKLQEELTAVREADVMDRDKHTSEVDRLRDTNDAENEHIWARLEAEVEALEAKYKATVSKCANEETAQRQLRAKKETQLSQMIQQYDREMAENTNRIRELQGEIDTDGDELAKVSTDLNRLLVAKEADEADAKLAADKKTHRFEIEAHLNRMATIIQSFYRAHAFRVFMANKNKKKKKKKA